jgi:hypothetical protein
MGKHKMDEKDNVLALVMGHLFGLAWERATGANINVQ